MRTVKITALHPFMTGVRARLAQFDKSPALYGAQNQRRQATFYAREAAEEMLKPYDANAMSYRPISTRINHVAER
ncbi:MAG: hypothetical protein WAM78_14820 [Candidatus Sulfotelmatobacter sp.]